MEQKSYDDLVARQQEILQILQSEKVQLQEKVDDLKKEKEQIQKLLAAYKSKEQELKKKKADKDETTKELYEEFETVDAELATRRRRLSSEAEDLRKKIQMQLENERQEDGDGDGLKEPVEDEDGLKESGNLVVKNNMPF